MGILILSKNNLLLISILLFYFCILILSFNFNFKSILFYIFSLIFIGRLFLLILFILSIRRLVLPTFNFINFIILSFVICFTLFYFYFIFIKFSDFSLSLNFVIILGFVILLVFLSFIVLLF